MNSQRVIIVHLRWANPTKHLSTSSQGEIKLWPESLGRALPLQDFSQGGLGRGLCQRRVRRRVTRIIFLVNKYFSIRPFFSNLTLNSTTMQLSFTKDFKEKVLVSIISFTSKDCVPDNKYAYSSDSSRRRIKLAHATNIQEIQPADIFFPTNVN